MRVDRHDGVLVIQLKRTYEGLLKFRQEMKRPSKKRYVSPDWLAAGKSADRLINDSLEDGSGQILLGSPFIDQRLYV